MREEVRARDAAVEKTSVLDLTFFEMFFDDDEAELLRIADEALPSDEAKPPQIVEAGPGHIPRGSSSSVVIINLVSGLCLLYLTMISHLLVAMLSKVESRSRTDP